MYSAIKKRLAKSLSIFNQATILCIMSVSLIGFLGVTCDAASSNYVNQVTLFEPAYFPISRFERIAVGTNVSFIKVELDVLKYFDARGSLGVELLANNLSKPMLIAPKNIVATDDGGGFGTVEIDLTGYTNITAVVVTNTISNRFPIVTHWQNADGGRFLLGASDALAIDSGARTNEISIDPISRTINAPDMVQFNSNISSGQSIYNPSLHLFNSLSSANITNENYLAETYNLYKPSNLLALDLSDKVVAMIGYPVRFLNYNDAPTENIPVWQVLNSKIVRNEDPTKSALATYLLPPYWNNDLPNHYPIVVNGQYDLNEDVYKKGFGFGLMVTVTQSQVPAIGLLWNNGGGEGAIGNHRSYFDNAQQMLMDAKNLFSGDWQNVITFGGSRGANQALAVAANPYYFENTYKVKTAIAISPPILIGDLVYETNVTTNPALASVKDLYTGFNQSWLNSWRNTESQFNSSESVCDTLTGYSTQEGANGESVGSAKFIDALVSKGTQVLLSHSTNDAFFPAYLALDYVSQLRKAGVKVRHELGFRDGHTGPTEMFDYVFMALQRLDAPEGFVKADENRLFIYTPQFNQGKYSGQRLASNLDHIPVASELPSVSYVGDAAKYYFVGQPGWKIKLSLAKIDSVEWQARKNIQFSQPEENIFIYEGTLPDLGANYDVSYLNVTQNTPNKTGYWLYQFYVRENANKEWRLVDRNQTAYALNENAVPHVQAVIQIFAKENDMAMPGSDFADLFGPYSRAMGLSDDAYTGSSSGSSSSSSSSGSNTVSPSSAPPVKRKKSGGSFDLAFILALCGLWLIRAGLINSRLGKIH